jgi:hypothetical protein
MLPDGQNVARWPDESATALPACEAELPVPSLQDIGISLEGLQVVGQTTSLAVTESGAPLASAPTSRNN